MVTQKQRLEGILDDIWKKERLILCAVYDNKNSLKAIRKDGIRIKCYEHLTMKSVQETAHGLVKALKQNAYVDTAVIKSKFGPFYVFASCDELTLAIVSQSEPHKKEWERYNTYHNRLYGEFGP